MSNPIVPSNGITIPPDEWGQWAAFLSYLFPCASDGEVQEGVKRIIKSLTYSGRSSLMGDMEVHARLSQTFQSLDGFKPGPNNVLAGG
jgi:hypothetical protein